MSVGPSILTMLFVVVVVLLGGVFILNTVSRITSSRSTKSRRQAARRSSSRRKTKSSRAGAKKSKRELRETLGDDDELMEMIERTLDGGRRER